MHGKPFQAKGLKPTGLETAFYKPITMQENRFNRRLG
jgi:hypothetical protein